jgi:hypothetical protein
MRKPVGTQHASLSHAAAAQGLSLRQRGGWREAMGSYGEAAGVAESGQTGLALEILGEFHAEHRKILLLDDGRGLPQAMSDYALSLAERLWFDLVLLCVDAGPRRAARFEARAREAARPVMDEAARRGVRCAHLSRRGHCDEAVNAASLELRRVEFVITRRPEAERRQSTLLVPEFSLKC